MNAIPPELRDITSEISIADPALLELATKSDTSPRNLAKCLGVHMKKLGNISYITYDHWETILDSAESQPILSKRAISAHISSMYDPLGLNSLFTLPGKLTLQLAWQISADWDIDLMKPDATGTLTRQQEELARLWEVFKRNVKLASQMRYPRYMFEG